MLRCHCAKLHEIYIDCKSNEISDALMKQIMYIEMMLAELESL